jgi:hypothetical protein
VQPALTFAETGPLSFLNQTTTHALNQQATAAANTGLSNVTRTLAGGVVSNIVPTN